MNDDIKCVIIDGIVYYNASSAAKYLQVSRFMFYSNVRTKVQAYEIKAGKRLLYKQSDLDKFRSVLPVAS